MTVGRQDVPDYSRPSVGVDRQTDAQWLWGVTHTIRAERLAPMLPDVEYGITVKVQRLAAEGERNPTFAGLYARAARIADARCRDFAGEDVGVHRCVMCHAWRAVPAGNGSLVFAIVMMGLSRPAAGRMPPPGEQTPTAEALLTGGGATIEEIQRRSPQRAAEVLVEFDHRHPAAAGAPPFVYSYGERVAVDTVESFEPFVRRAEEHAQAHEALFDMPGTAATPSSIIHREWYAADNLVTVELRLKP